MPPDVHPTPVAAYARWLVRRPWLVLALTALAVAPLAAGVTRLEFTGDYRVFFSPENPLLAAFEELQRDYDKKETLLFAVEAREGDVFRRETLAAVAELTERAGQIPHAVRVDSLTSFPRLEARGGALAVSDLVPDPSRLGPDELERLRRRALAEPQLVDRLLARDGRVAGVSVPVAFESDEGPERLLEAVAAARALAAEIEGRHPQVEVYLGGAVMLHNAFLEATQKDLATLVPLMYLAILGLMALVLRSLAATFVTVVVILVAALAAMGFAGWAGIALTPVSAVAPTLLMTLAVADCVHLMTTLLQELRRGAAKDTAIVEALRVNFPPVLLTSVTTAVGFLSMNLSDAPPLHDLGNVTAVGIAAAFAGSVFTLPALVAVLPLRPAARPAGARPFFARLADFVIARRRALLVAGALVTATLAAFVPRIELDDRTTRYFDERLPFRRDADFISARLTGVHQIEYSITAGERGGVADPEYLEALDRFAAWWRRQEDVVHVDSFSDVLKRLHRGFHGGDERFDALPESRQQAARYLLVYEMSLPQGLDLAHQVRRDRAATRFSVTLGEVSSRRIVELAERGEAWLRAEAPPSMSVRGVGPSVMFARIALSNIRSMAIGTVLAVALISLCLVVALRSWKFGLMSLVPNLVPTVLGFGLWGLTVGSMGFLLSIVLAMTLGIVVDDSVHFLSKYLRARRELGLGPRDAVRHALSTVGQALVVTTAVLTAGFLILSLSTFAQNSDMGRLSALILALALVADLLLLPPLVLAIDRGSDTGAQPAKVIEHEAQSTVSKRENHSKDH